MTRPWIGLAPLILATSAQAHQQVSGAPVTGPVAQPQCAYGPQDEEAEIVVCGSRARRGTFRIIPRQNDPDRQITQSWGAQVSRHIEMARWGDQTVGPFGYLQRSAERNAQWREERRQIRARERYRGD